MTTDVVAISRILQQQHAYDKPDAKSRPLARLFGSGLLVAVGDEHHMQRRILNPAFGPSQARALTGIFVDKANEVLFPSSIMTRAH
jgi:cytochrome P450